MRIGIEVQRLFRKKKHGMDLVAYHFLKTLAHLDSQHKYFVFTKHGPDICIENSKNITIIQTENTPYPIWEQYILPKLAKKYKCDILHCTSNTAPLFLNIPLYLTLHDIIFMEKWNITGNLYQTFGNIYRRFLLPHLVIKAKRIITVSYFEENNINAFFREVKRYKSSNTRTVYNGVGENFYLESDQKLLQKKRKELFLPKRFILLFANTDPKKNTERAIIALANVLEEEQDFSVVIIDSNTDFISSILRANNKSELIKKFIILDYVKHNELVYLYNLSSIFFYPSIRESFGLPPLEAMKCGIPTVASKTSAIPEVCRQAVEYIDPYSIESMSAGISKLIKNNLLKDELIRKGFANVSDFSWSNTANSIIKLYNEIEDKT